MTEKCSIHGCQNTTVARQLCQKHYMRWQRHGHVLETRPDDWGSRHSHPLYQTWKHINRTYWKSGQLDETWKDFWKFAGEVVSRPDGDFIFCRKDKAGKFGPGNWYWRPFEKLVGTKLERTREWHRKKRASDPSFSMESSLKKQYGLSLDDYTKMHDAQNGLCAICGKPERAAGSNNKLRRLAVDHCHTTGKIRGLLCTSCNRGVGYLGDSVENLQSAINYLSRSINK